MPLTCKCQTHHMRTVRVVQSGGASVADDVYQRGDGGSIGPDMCDHLEPVCGTTKRLDFCIIVIAIRHEW